MEGRRSGCMHECVHIYGGMKEEHNHFCAKLSI